MYRVLTTVVLARIGNFVDIGNHYVQGTRTLSSWPALRWAQRRFGKSCLQQAQRRRKTFSALISFSRPPRMSESFAHRNTACNRIAPWNKPTLRRTVARAGKSEYYEHPQEHWILWTPKGTLSVCVCKDTHTHLDKCISASLSPLNAWTERDSKNK